LQAPVTTHRHAPSKRLPMLATTLVCLATLQATPILPAYVQPEHITDGRVRARFVAQLAKVDEGMSRAEVRKLLGKPDDILNAAECDDVGFNAEEIWCYGTNGHRTLPALGWVWFFPGGKAMGKDPEMKPTSGLPQERILRPLLRLLDSNYYLGAGGYGHDPITLIRLTNALLPLGKAKALAVLNEYQRVQLGFSDQQYLGSVLQLLFETPPNGRMPRVSMRLSNPEPADLSLTPRFPLLVQDDLPIWLGVPLGFSTGPGFLLNTRPFQDGLAFRRTQYAPPDNPFDVAEELFQSDQWIFDEPYERRFDGLPHIDEKVMRERTYHQLLLMIRTVLPEKEFRSLISIVGSEARWNGLKERLRRDGLRWDEDLGFYVLEDGSYERAPEVFFVSR
jgi:hypothetical protein